MKLFKSKNRKTKATNKSLNDLFTYIDSIQIKSDGVNEDKALSNNIVLKIDDSSRIQEFKELITINEPNEDFHCMCLGDAELKHPDELLELLSELGLKAPLEQKY